MENTEPTHRENPEGKPEAVETDYGKHENNPGPSPEAVNEDNDKGAGPVMKWIIPVLIVILLVYWFVFRN